MLDFFWDLSDIVKVMSNFLFLKKNNENLFKIISEAENLFRDEYFEQSIVQIRRFAENVCRDLLHNKVSSDDTFDTLINKIKDNSFQNTRMKEFSEDLYFLKRHGNNSAHSSSASKNGKLALECLERAYEISIFYSNIKYGYTRKLDKAIFSEELLMTGKKSAKNLKEKYTQELKKARSKTAVTKTKQKKQKSKKGKSKILPVIITVAVVIIIFLLFFSLSK